MARPETDERLPALLLLPGQEGISSWMRQNGRELASIGYVSLVVDSEKGEANREDGVLAEERGLAKLSAAVRWLRRRPDVLPEAIGVAGWAQAGARALALAGSMPLQACVICDGQISKDAALLAGLRGTPVLAIFAGKDGHIESVPIFRKALETARVPHKICVYEGVSSGFMDPRRTKAYAEETADRVWVEIYEFLGKHVEDAPLKAAGVALSEKGRDGQEPVATIADIMRAINDARGVRGTLVQSLENEPSGAKEWGRVRAQAALIAEAGRLLRGQVPLRGNAPSWSEKASAYEKTALQIVTASDQHDYAGVRLALTQLAKTCAACHEVHR